ncbi:hypothetical protein BJF78_05430 [Pseudonocardia sp. CNS-139]|nr:hypothetical protein BJF78_05430 [Pseudonocardia sp. CNS-139]
MVTVPVRSRASRNRSPRPSQRSSTVTCSGVASQTACCSVAPGAAASTAGRWPSRFRRPAAQTAATPVVRASSTTTGSAPSPSAVRSQVILLGQRLEPYASTGTRPAAGAAPRSASQASSGTPPTCRPGGPPPSSACAIPSACT